MSDARRAALASALAPLAVLAVVVAGVSAVVVLPGDDGGSGPGDPTTAASSGSPTDGADDGPTVPDGRRLVTGDGTAGAVFTVPETDDWSLADGTNIGYSSADGETTVGVDSPALYGEGFCEDAEGLVYRAFVGFTASVAPGDATVQEAARDTLDGWVGVLADGAEGSRGGAAGDTSVTPVRLDDGSAGWTGAQVVDLTEPESGCDPEARELRVVSVATPVSVATVVLLRDVRADGRDLPDGLSADEADEVLRTLAPQ